MRRRSRGVERKRVNRNLFENFSSGLTRLGANVAMLFRGGPKLTPAQELLLEQMEEDYERIFGKPGAPDAYQKKAETESKAGGHQ
jgi:hypothetical protein